MPFADSARTILGLIEEITWGTTPATPELTALRLTGEGLKADKTPALSEEIRSDRQITDAAIVGVGASGPINFEFSFAEYDKLIEHGMLSVFSTSQTITGTDLSLSGAQLLSAANAFNASDNKVGQWLKIAGSVPSSNDGFYQIAVSAIGALDLKDISGATASFTADSANASLTYKSSAMIRNGTTKKSFTLEKGMEDVSEYFQFTGMRTNQISLDMGVESIITGSADFIGKDVTSSASTIDNAGGYTASQTKKVMNTSSNVLKLQEAGVTLVGTLRSLNFNVNNNMRSQPGLANTGAAGIGVGRANVSGTFEAYFEDNALYAKYLAETETSLAVVLQDTDLNAIVITFPRVKLMDSTVVAGSADSDILASFDFQALREAANNRTIQFDMIPV